MSFSLRCRAMLLCSIGIASGAASGTAADPASRASPASPEGLGGAAIAGVCMVSREAIFTNAKVGKAASERLKQLSDAAQAEIDTQRKPLDAELAKLQTEAAKLSAAERATREQGLAKRLEALRLLAAHRSREIEATRIKAMERISIEAQPALADAYKRKQCGLLIDRNVVLGGNLDNDLTVAVVAGLDARITTITFDRESLPTQSDAASAP